MLLPLAFLYLSFDLPVPEKQLLNLIHDNPNIDFAEKLLFFLGIVKNKPAVLLSDSSDIFYSLLLESLDNTSDAKCGDICKYFIYTCIFTSKGAFYDDQMVKFNQKISNMLNNITFLGPKENNLSTFKFWQAICCFRPMFDMNLFVTTFHHIIVNWLPQIEIKGSYISLTNFIHWGCSEDKDILIKSKISLDNDSVNVLKPNINMDITLNRIYDLGYIEFDESNKSWNKGCFKNFKLIINLNNWLFSNMTSFSNKLGILRLIWFIKEEVNSKTLADIGFNKVFNYIIENLDEKQTIEEVRVLVNNYDLFAAEKLFKEHQAIVNFLNKIFKSIIYITSYDCEKDKIEIFYINEVIKSPLQELNYSDKCKLLRDMMLYEFENLKFQNYSFFNLKIDNYLQSLEKLQSIERITIINELIFQLKHDINNEIIHTVDSINTQCLLLGKIIGSPILMESQSKNKMIKLWLSIFCMSSPYTQPHGLDSIKNIFKRIDVPSQVAIFNKVLNNVVYKQPIDCQYELLFKFGKISKHSFSKSITELLKIYTEERVQHLSLLLKKLVNHYKKDSISELIQFAGISFMAFFWSNYYKNDLGKLFFAAMYETEISISENASLILEDKYNRTNFVASVLASTDHLGNVAVLGIKELFPKDIIKTQLLISGGFDLPFECIQVFGLSSFCKLGDEASSYLQLEVELDSLAVGTLMDIVNSLCEISSNIESIKIQQLMFENENVSIYEGGGISISQMKIVENFKQVDGSSLVLKGNFLKLFSILENQDLDDDSIILTLRKIKVLYLLVEIFSQKDFFIENLRNCILKSLIQIPHFKSYFKTFRCFFFAIIDRSTKIESYITTEIFLKVLDSSITLDNFEMTALEKMTFNSYPILEINFECLKLLGYTKQCDKTTQFVEIEYRSSPVELLLRHFISSAKICHLFLSKKYSFQQQKKFWFSKFPQRYISMLDWDNIDYSFKNYLLNNLNNLSNNFKNLIELSPLENMIFLFYGKTFATYSATEEFKLNLVFCFLKTLLKNPSFNNIIPPLSFIYENLNVHIKNGIDMTDICTILEFNKSDTAFPLDFKTTDSYRVTLYSLWNKLTSHFIENTIWKCIHIIDFQFDDYSLIETSIIECFSESLDLKTFVIRYWGEWVPSLTSTIEMTKIDSKKKKELLLKLFLRLRFLHYEQKNTPGADELYSFFDLKKLSEFALDCGFNELSFMLLEEEKRNWDDTKKWQSVFQKLDDCFLSTSIPRSQNLIEYIQEAGCYINDTRFSKSTLSFNSGSLDLNLEYKHSIKNLSNTFWEAGNYSISNSLNLKKIDTDFSKYYDDIISWDIPLTSNKDTTVNNTNSMFYKFVNNLLVTGKKDIKSDYSYRTELVFDSLKVAKNEIVRQITGMLDERLPVLNKKTVTSLDNLNIFLSVPNCFRAINPDYMYKSDKFMQINNGIKEVFKFNSRYGTKMTKNLLNGIIALEEQQLLISELTKKNSVNNNTLVEKGTVDYLEGNFIKRKDTLCNLHFLDFKFSYDTKNLNNCIKSLLKLFKIINDHENPKNFEYSNWNFILQYIDANCRWLSGDTQSSWNLLNFLLRKFDDESDALPFDYKLQLMIKKCLWSLESKKCSNKEAWVDFYDIFEKSISSASFQNTFNNGIDKISSYYHNFINERFQKKHSFKELDIMAENYIDLNKKFRILKNNIQKDSSKKDMSNNKLKQNLKILGDNLKFLSDRYFEELKTLNEYRNLTLTIASQLLNLMSLEITKDVTCLYDEEIDRFFSVWFGLINYLSSDLFDGDDRTHEIVERLQRDKNYYFKTIYKYETFNEKCKRTNLAPDIDAKKRSMIVNWDGCLQKWKNAVDLIVEKHPASLLPWLSTIFSKLGTGKNNIFERLLEESLTVIILKCLELYPTITVHIGLSYKNYANENNQKAKERAELISFLFERKQIQNNKLNILIKNYQNFSKFSESLANSKAINKLSNISIKNDHTCNIVFHKNAADVLSIFNTKNQILLPIINFVDNKLYENDTNLEQYFIAGIDSIISLSNSGLSKPRIFNFILQNGLSYKVLIKGNDDLRTDYIMLNAMNKINKSIFKNTNYSIATYEVFPMGHNFGILEFKKGCESLADILRPLHQKDEISLAQCRKLMDSAFKARKTDQERAKVFENIQTKVTPRFSEFLKSNFPIVELWYSAKKKFLTSLAVNSIIGYILGIGDRHMSNIMINCDTGELVHIDFGITFEAGKHLSIPELVPFRFTRDIADALGIYHHYHTVDKFFEDVYKMVRDERSKVMLSLENLKLDPLYKWSLNADEKYFKNNENDESDLDTDEFKNYNYGVDNMAEMIDNSSTSKRQKLSENNNYNQSHVITIEKTVKNDESIAEQHSTKCLKVVLDKLQGGEERQSVESVIQILLRDAQSTVNLGVIFCGWSPFY